MKYNCHPLQLKPNMSIYNGSRNWNIKRNKLVY